MKPENNCKKILSETLVVGTIALLGVNGIVAYSQFKNSAQANPKTQLTKKVEKFAQNCPTPIKSSWYFSPPIPSEDMKTKSRFISQIHNCNDANGNLLSKMKYS